MPHRYMQKDSVDMKRDCKVGGRLRRAGVDTENGGERGEKPKRAFGGLSR